MVLLQQSGCTGRSLEFISEEGCIIWNHAGLPTIHSCCSGPVSKQKAWLVSLCKVLATAKTVLHCADCDCYSAITRSNPVTEWRQQSNSSCSAVMRAIRACYEQHDCSDGANSWNEQHGGSKGRQSQTEGNSNESQTDG